LLVDLKPCCWYLVVSTSMDSNRTPTAQWLANIIVGSICLLCDYSAMSNIARKWESIPSIIKNTSMLWIPTEYILKRQYLARVWISGCWILGNKEWECWIDLFPKNNATLSILNFPIFLDQEKRHWLHNHGVSTGNPSDFTYLLPPKPGLWKGPTLGEVIGIDAGPGPQIPHGWIYIFLRSNFSTILRQGLVKQATLR
jgi:hypothetical protein